MVRQVLFLIGGILALATACHSVSSKENPVYKDPKQSVDVRVDDLLGRMTLAEKVGQLNQQLPGRSLNPNNKVEQKQIVIL